MAEGKFGAEQLADGTQALLDGVQQLYDSKDDLVDGVRQITKQVDNIVIPRSIARNGENVLPKDAMTLHRIALRVGEDLSPGEFEYILKEQYDLTLDGYAELMSSYLD